MTDVTRILNAIEQGDPSAAEGLLPLVYAELRELAAAKMREEKPGQTLQATALVHEAYLRLVDVEKAQHWNSRGHFFRAAAEAMRRILVEGARRREFSKRGGDLKRFDLSPSPPCRHPRGRGLLHRFARNTKRADGGSRIAERVFGRRRRTWLPDCIG